MKGQRFKAHKSRWKVTLFVHVWGIGKKIISVLYSCFYLYDGNLASCLMEALLNNKLDESCSNMSLKLKNAKHVFFCCDLSNIMSPWSCGGKL